MIRPARRARRRRVPLIAALLLAVLPLGTAPAGAQTVCPAGHVALTFDDGPHPQHTPEVLDILSRKRVRAAFFVLGSRTAEHPDLVARIAAEGHQVFNHTWDHADLTALPDPGITMQLQRTAEAISAAGVPPQPLMRPPYGSLSDRARAAVTAVGYVPVLWTIDTRDWRRSATMESITADALPAPRVAADGAILLLHDGLARSSPVGHPTVAALPGIIDGLRARGLCFGVLDQGGAVVASLPRPTPSVGASPSQAEAASRDGDTDEPPPPPPPVVDAGPQWVPLPLPALDERPPRPRTVSQARDPRAAPAGAGAAGEPLLMSPGGLPFLLQGPLLARPGDAAAPVIPHGGMRQVLQIPERVQEEHTPPPALRFTTPPPSELDRRDLRFLLAG